MSPAVAGRTDTAAPSPSPWAVGAAYAVPLCILPSAVWRLTVHDGSAPYGYLVFLSVLSMGLGLLTLGLVQPWGRRVPRWVPRIGGRPVPPRPVALAATLGGWSLVALCAYFLLNKQFHLVEHGWVGIGDATRVHPRPDWEVLRYYVPLVAWGPLLLAVTADFRRRVAPVPSDPGRP